jgi:hypothetical protein
MPLERRAAPNVGGGLRSELGGLSSELGGRAPRMLGSCSAPGSKDGGCGEPPVEDARPPRRRHISPGGLGLPRPSSCAAWLETAAATAGKILGVCGAAEEWWE